MRILVTGGEGLVGRPLTRLLAHGHDVLSVDLEVLDVTDPTAVGAAFERFRPQHVIHLAAWTDVDGCERDPERAQRVNADAVRNVAAACRTAGAPLLYVSTDYVFDGRKTAPYTEDDPVAPLSAYGRSKLRGEEHARALAPQWRIVRCQSIYGRGRKSFVDAILERARAGHPLSVVTDQRVSPTYAPDVAAALVSILSAPPGLYLAASEGSCTWFECAATALRLCGVEAEMTPITAAELGRPAPRPANSAFDCTRLAEKAGHRMRPWQDALAEYLATNDEEAGR